MSDKIPTPSERILERIERIDSKISLSMIPSFKGLSRRLVYINILLWILILSVWALSGIVIAGYIYG